MRHSNINLTMNTYTDPRLLDVAGAVEALPELPPDGGGKKERERATGTDGAAASLAPTLAPTSGFSCKSVSISGKTADAANSGNMPLPAGKTAYFGPKAWWALQGSNL